MNWKGYTTVSVSKITFHRLLKVKMHMMKTEPDKYPAIDMISNNAAVTWLIDNVIR